MSVVIDSKVSIPMSNADKFAFKTWIRDKYVDYASYKAALRNDNSIDTYVRTNILTQDMKTMWIESESYVNVKSDDLGVKRIQLYRSRINNKVKYMKMKLGEFAYKEELLAIRRQEQERVRLANERRRADLIRILTNEIGEERYREFIISNPQVTEANMLSYLSMSRRNRNIVKLGVNVTYTKKEISQEDAESLMTDDCCICMEKHTLNSVIQGSCGHQIGKCCFQEWANKSKTNVYCPLCRADCNHVSELVVSIC